MSNQLHTPELRAMVAQKYLDGVASTHVLASEYNISARSVLQRWIKKYNANRELKDYDPKREVYMAETRRKTTLEERKEIVEYCVNYNRNYKDTVALYDVSYSQVYS